MPFYSGARAADICVVLGTIESSTDVTAHASGLFEPAAS